MGAGTPLQNAMTGRSGDTGRQPTGVLPSRRRTDLVDADGVDARDVLARLRTLDVYAWRETLEDGGEARHVGPPAEDFHDVFEVGADANRIPAGDVDGVAMAAIQGLADRLDDRDATVERQERLLRHQREVIDEQRDDIETLREHVESLQASLSRLRRDLDDGG